MEHGEFWIAGAILGFAGSNFFDRVAVVQVDPFNGALVKSIPSLVFAIVLLTVRGKWAQMRPASASYIGGRAVWLFTISGVVSIAGLVAYFYALRRAGLAVTIPFLQTQILWATVIGWVFMQERLHAQALAGIATVVAGLMLLSYGQMLGRPVSSSWPSGIPLALAASLSFATTGAIARAGQLRGADQSTGMFLRFGTSIVMVSALVAATGRLGVLSAASARDIGALLLSGVLNGVVAMYCFFTALRFMSVGRAFAINGLNPIVAVVLGTIFLHEYINTLMWAGIALATVGILLVQLFKPAEKKAA
jgi:drug/metabolite transporter (DMT)-like permease